MAKRIAINSKLQRPGVCNALETLLVHSDIAPEFLGFLLPALTEHGVAIRGCSQVCSLYSAAQKASDRDWHEEYLDLILAVRVVSSLDEAINHIEQYGSSHTESIVTESYQNSQEFLSRVNSSVVLVNASTRFNDGGQLGLGAEIGISTTKIHAFGPMGLEELTTRKFIVYGNGHIRD